MHRYGLLTRNAYLTTADLILVMSVSYTHSAPILFCNPNKLNYSELLKDKDVKKVALISIALQNVSMS